MVVMVVFVCRVIAEKPKEVLYSHQRKYIQSSNQELPEPGYVNIRELAEAMCRYDLDDVDLYWLNMLNKELERMGKSCRLLDCKGNNCVQPFKEESCLTRGFSLLKGRSLLMS